LQFWLSAHVLVIRSMSVYLNNLSQVGDKGKWVLLSHPGYTIMEQLLLSLAISDVSQMGYELQGVEGIFLPCLKSAQEPSAHMMHTLDHAAKASRQQLQQ